MSLQVLDPGLYSLVVDGGRPHSRGLGVPVGGAADRSSLAVGNALVGNRPDAAALEITLAGPTLKAACSLGVVLYGAPFALQGSRHPEQSLRVGKTFVLEADEELHIGGTATGARAYLCIRGGLHAPRILGSQSALSPLRAGQRLECSPHSVPTRFLTVGAPVHAEEQTLRVVAGPQADWFASACFYVQSFEVTPASNRMGLRLRGQPLIDYVSANTDVPPRRELVSEPVAPGAVQVTREGQCIVLGVDGQTIGGYPKIAHVISADLDLLGQLRPGQRVRFQEVSLSEAEALFRARQARLDQWVMRLLVSLGEPTTDS